MKKTTIVAAAVILVSAGLGATPFALDHFTTDTREDTFTTAIKVIPDGNNTSIGLAASHNLNFGAYETEANVTKFVKMNTGNYTVLSTLEAEGNITEFITYPDKVYFQGVKRIPVKANPQKVGYYTGNVTVKTQIPKNEVGKKWLKLKSYY